MDVLYGRNDKETCADNGKTEVKEKPTFFNSAIFQSPSNIVNDEYFDSDRMGSRPILPVSVCITIDTMLKFVSDYDGDCHIDVTCEQSFTGLVGKFGNMLHYG